MHHRIAPGQRRAKRFGVGEIADVRFARDPLQIGEVAGLANEQAKLRPLGSELLRHVVADKSGCACEKDFHS